MSMPSTNVNIMIKITWVQNAAIFICRYVKKKWALKLLARLTVAKIYAEGKLVKTMKLKDCVEL